MRIPIDAAGRLVVPKALRDAAGTPPLTAEDVQATIDRLRAER